MMKLCDSRLVTHARIRGEFSNKYLHSLSLDMSCEEKCPFKSRLTKYHKLNEKFREIDILLYSIKNKIELLWAAKVFQDSELTIALSVSSDINFEC